MFAIRLSIVHSENECISFIENGLLSFQHLLLLLTHSSVEKDFIR